MSEADEDEPKHCNLASLLCDLDLLFPSRRTLHRDTFYLQDNCVILHETSQRMVVKDFRQKGDIGS